MLEYLNSAACLVLMLYSLPIATAIGNRGMLLERLSIVAVLFGLFLGATNPWVGWQQPSPWTEVYLNVAASVMLTIWRRRAWIFVLNYLAPVDLKSHRRASDWPASDATAAPAVHTWRHTPKA